MDAQWSEEAQPGDLVEISTKYFDSLGVVLALDGKRAWCAIGRLDELVDEHGEVADQRVLAARPAKRLYRGHLVVVPTPAEVLRRAAAMRAAAMRAERGEAPGSRKRLTGVDRRRRP